MAPYASFLVAVMASSAAALPASQSFPNAGSSGWVPSTTSAWNPPTSSAWSPSSGSASPPVPTQSGSAAPPPPTQSGSASPPAPTQSGSPGSTGLGDAYTFYTGDGTVGQGWPDQNSWVDFDTMWSNNQAFITESCSQFSQANDSPDEINDILSAINSVSSASGVDARFILATIMQESKGCVRVWTTNFGVRNPGLMQDHDGSGTCNDNGSVQDPCPSEMITQMVVDGTEGTSAGDGLVQVLAQAGASDVSQYYEAARMYNSGSIDASGDLGAGIATHCYSSDIANRLTGWVLADSTCTLDG